MGSITYGPILIDRVEKKYEVGINDAGIVTLWRELTNFLSTYGLVPSQEITSVGSVYFENSGYDLLRYSLAGNCHSLHVRLRAYEQFGRPPEPISDYWVEVKIREDEVRRKKRFRIERDTLSKFLMGENVEEWVINYNNGATSDPKLVRHLQFQAQDTMQTLGLRPTLLVTYKRLALQNARERVSIDWDIQYFHVGAGVLFYDTWKYPIERPVGRAEKTMLEFKYPEGSSPLWIGELSRRFPIWEKDYSKFLAGMWFLFKGPLKDHEDASFFLDGISSSHKASINNPIG